MKVLGKPFLLILAIILVGCGERREIMIENVRVESAGWDTLPVNTSFLSRTDFGSAIPISPDTLTVTLFDSRFDTLYSGSETEIVFQDSKTGDTERVMVEVCGEFGVFKACEQAVHYASPKRTTINPEITYPRGEDDYGRGSYDLNYRLERQLPGGENWEQLSDPENLSLEVHVSIHNASSGAIHIPVDSETGNFSLKSSKGYDNFQYDLMSQLVDSSEAIVSFVVYDVISAVALVEVQKVITSKSDVTRDLEAGLFVEEAGRRLLNELRTFSVGTERYVFLNDWTYLQGPKKYVIQMDIGWRSSFIRSRWFEISGQLEIDSDGGSAVFTAVEGNSRGMRRWRNRFDNASVPLGDLQTTTSPIQ